jgi:hypothetical protein
MLLVALRPSDPSTFERKNNAAKNGTVNNSGKLNRAATNIANAATNNTFVIAENFFMEN